MPDPAQQRESRWVTGAAVVALVVWSAFAGRDLSWDVLNHHLYLPFSLLSGRFATDFMAAGPQSTQNPLGFVPFYALVAAGWPNALIGLVLTVAHGLVAWPLHRIAVALFGAGVHERGWRFAAVAMAMLAPVYLLTAGTSSLDPLGALLVLVALASALGDGATRRRAIVAGICLGLAVAIKPTHALFAAATFAVLALQATAGNWHWSRVLEVLLATAIAAIAAWGPWALWLWRRFGNPVFPLANDVFRSPFMAPDAMVAWRFIPGRALQWLTRPWEMAEFRHHVYIEEFAADLRPLVVLVLVVCLALWHGLRRPVSTLRSVKAAGSTGGLRRAAGHAALQLGVYVLLVYAAWLRSSGNGRYALAWFLVVGVLLAWLMHRLPQRFGRVLLLLVLVLQAGYGVSETVTRLSPTPWSFGPYLAVEMPSRLRETPYLHLTMGLQSNSALALTLHTQGALSNVSGQLSLPAVGPAGAAVSTLMQQWAGRTRVLFVWADAEHGQPLGEPARQIVDRVLERFALEVDASDCLLLRWQRATAREGIGKLTNPPMWSCATRPLSVRDTRHAREAQEADELFALVEQRCPRWLAPRPMVSEPTPDGWVRRYVNPDLRLTWVRGDGFYLAHYRQMVAIRLGSVGDVRRGSLYDPCRAAERLRPP